MRRQTRSVTCAWCTTKDDWISGFYYPVILRKIPY